VGFFLKWIDEAGGEPQSSKPFASSAEAENCASYMLKYFRQKPAKIWVEEAGGSLRFSWSTEAA
jgi:hypothetical protein